MHYDSTLRLTLMATALSVALIALTGCASLIPQSKAESTKTMIGDGTKQKIGDGTFHRHADGTFHSHEDGTSHVEQQAKVAKPQPEAYEGAALQKQADITMPPLPTAQAGECYARKWIEPTYDIRPQQRLKQAATTRVKVIPARYETVEEQVVVKEASKEYQVIPAVYETVKERVMVKPAYTKTVSIPATYDTYTEKVLVRPAYTTWQPGDNGGITKIDEVTGELMCLVEVPAEYDTVTKRKLREPARTEQVQIPAEYAEVEKRVLKTPERTVVKEIPAQYETRKVTKLVAPAREVQEQVPPEYEAVPTKVLVSEGSYEWRSVLCKTNATEAKISEIQRELQSRGYYQGEIDGILGPQTIAAVNAFEEDEGLEVDKFLKIDTVTALGVSPK